MKRFKKYFGGGHIVEGFAILPSISYNWMYTSEGKVWELTFSWMFWYCYIGNVRIYLNKWK